MPKLIARSSTLALIASLALPSLANTELDILKRSYQRPDSIPFPSDNPYTAEKAQLGKMLFFDQRLSRNCNMTCATCHNPSMGWEDGVPRAVGDINKTLGRHTPTILNMAWGKDFFWDGRAATLEQQARGPIEADVEMNTPMSLVIERLNKVDLYRQQFQRIFNAPANEQNVLQAIATYERTIVSGSAPFDRWVEGEENAISNSAKQGFVLFNGKAGCSKCHSGWNFTDNQFHDIGLASPDQGRYKITGQQADLFAFKTPGLRNIGQRQPDMHDGSLPSLDVVLGHYIGGGIPRPSRSEKMLPAPLTAQELQQLKAFLLTLDGDDKPVSLPILPQ